MKRRLISLLVAAGLMAGAAAAAQDRQQQGAIFRVPVTGVVELGLAPFIERTIAEAERVGAAAIILDIETPGGRVDAAQRIVRAISETDVPVYAFVNVHAWSAGAMIAMAADRIYMRTGASMGAATPVTGEGATAPEKIVSAMRGEMRALAEARGLDPRVAEAMVDEEIAIEGVIAEGKLLSMTPSEAAAVGYATEVASWDALLAELGLQEAPVYTATVNWAERIVRFLTHPMVAPLLLSLGMLGLIFEVKSPGLGVPGLVGALSLTAFFGGHFLIGLAGWEELILLVGGIVLLAVEMFVLPGFGIAGVAGVLAILAAFYLSMLNVPMATGADYAQALGVLSLSIIVVIVAGWALLRMLPRSRGFSRSGLVLGDATTRETGYLSNVVRAELVGAVGVALTDLRPAGAGRFGEERIDVVSDANWIGAGTPIRIVRSDGYRHVVQAVD
jgi:membrane-bound serine protease (ClpP class)